MAARAATAALLRSAARKIASRALPLHPRHFSRYARPGGYTQPTPPHPPVQPPTGTSSRYSRPGGYAPPVPLPPTGSAHLSRYSRSGGYASTSPPPPATTRASGKDRRLPSRDNNPSAGAGSSELLARARARAAMRGYVVDDPTQAATYLTIVGGFLLLCWAKRKDARDAAARRKADDELFDAMLRDGYERMMRAGDDGDGHHQQGPDDDGSETA